MIELRFTTVLWVLGGLAATALMVVVLLASGTPVAHAGDRKDCSDFRTQKRAQRWFNHHHPRRDPSHLDADNDLIPCENNSCPCSRRWHRQHGKLAAVKVGALAEPARVTAIVG
jgi:Excalibur calcium-binding domain